MVRKKSGLFQARLFRVQSIFYLLHLLELDVGDVISVGFIRAAASRRLAGLRR
jgi:hypothetical protein